jgi:regulatory protein
MRFGPTPGSPADLQPDADPEAVARAIVLRALNASPRSRAELESRLLERGVADGVATRVLDWCEEIGLIDDEAYAGLVIRSKQRSRGLGRRALVHELRRRGVEDHVAEVALAVIDDDREEEVATRFAERKLRTMTALDSATKVKRLAAMLARRGYGTERCLRVARSVVDATGS